jgi:peptidoglycan-associated lipoprotein
MKTNLLRISLMPLVVLSLVGCARKEYLREEAPALSKRASLPSWPDESLAKVLAETTLHYEYDAATLSADDMAKLDKLAGLLRYRGSAHIRIAGHCDERGTEEYNLALGQKRAEAAKTYLVNLGVSKHQVETITFGEEVPVVWDSTD